MGQNLARRPPPDAQYPHFTPGRRDWVKKLAFFYIFLLTEVAWVMRILGNQDICDIIDAPA